MIKAPLNIELLRQAASVMQEFGLEALYCEEFTLKRGPNRKVEKPVTDQEVMQKHFQALPEEPWTDITDDQLNNFSLNGKLE